MVGDFDIFNIMFLSLINQAKQMWFSSGVNQPAVVSGKITGWHGRSVVVLINLNNAHQISSGHSL
jgi:hypothetical protein